MIPNAKECFVPSSGVIKFQIVVDLSLVIIIIYLILSEHAPEQRRRF